MAMTLTNYVTGKSGAWATQTQSESSNMIELTGYDDAVTLQGPLSLNIAVVAEVSLMPVSGGDARTSISDLYSYDVEVPAGYTWQYQMADSPAGQRVSGFKVIIRQAPCYQVPRPQAPDLPCDYAVCDQTNIGQFFPVACEPCGNGPVRLPPTCGPSLAVMPASGGCVRPRFFNGMFITREDLETQLRYLRLKNQLQRRADGDGVVWGLSLGRDGGAVVVHPGYAVDCCGNDLIVTSTYRVDSTTLLSDPAICNQIVGKQQCLSLLLEYVECPEQPRPVHGGDACSGAPAGCEMSRVRETVRLRLVPTRTYQPRGPIQRFLDSLKANAFGTQAGNGLSGNQTTGGTVTNPSTIPFQISIAGVGKAQLTPSGSQVPVSVIDLQPSTTAVVTQAFTVSGGTALIITMPAANVMSGGTVQETQASPAGAMPPTNISLPQGTQQPISWQIDVSGQISATAVYTVQNWTMPAGTEAPGGVYSGTTAITVTTYTPAGTAAPVSYMQVEIAPAQITLTTAQTTPFPCLTDPCCAETPLFAIAPPWADESPFFPGKEADLGVILLGVIYVLLQGATAQNNAHLAQYRTLYAAIAQTVDPNTKSGDALTSFTTKVQQLLADLCCSLLYPGPMCEGEPHGVVVGCATIAGGAIERVDPWSGRRWVMHYPLWSYWGAQFGLVPPDVLASRLFSFICCVAGLSTFANGVGTDSGASFGNAGTLSNSINVPVGSGQIVVDPAASAPAQTLSLPTFAARTLAALSAQPAAANTPMIDIGLAGNPAIRLRVPDTSAASAATTSGATVPAAPALDLVQSALATADARAAVPPLLRGFAAKLGGQLLDAMPLTSLKPPSEVLGPLMAAGVTSVGALLARAPDTVYQTVMGKTQAAALSTLVTSAESAPTSVARAVMAGIKAVAAKNTLVTTDDLAAADTRKALVTPLAQSLNLPAKTVATAVTAALA